MQGGSKSRSPGYAPLVEPSGDGRVHLPKPPHPLETDFGSEPGIFAAVAVATFGGVKMQGGKGQPHRVHPALLLVLCAPCFLVQLCTIQMLRTGMNYEAKVYTQGDAHSEAILKLKLMLVFVVYLTCYGQIRSCIYTFALMLNPVTWLECESFDLKSSIGYEQFWTKVAPAVSEERKLQLNKVNQGFAVFCSFAALFMRFGIVYLVCVDSVSIILSGDSAMSAVFDALAIEFVAQLDCAWWKFCKQSFCLGDIEHFEVELHDARAIWKDDQDGGGLRDDVQNSLPCGGGKIMAAILRLTTCRRRQSFLRNGHGAGKVRAGTTMVLTILLYLRQFFIVVRAVDTKRLPVARDLCYMLDLKMAREDWFAVLYKLVDQILFARLSSSDEELGYLVNKRNLRQFCESGGKDGTGLDESTSFMEAMDLARRHAVPLIVFFSLVGVFFVLPSVMKDIVQHLSHRRISGTHERHDRLNDLKKRVDVLQGEIDRLKKRNCAKVVHE